MPAKGTLTYVTSPQRPGSRQSRATYYLATPTNLVRFYVFDEPKEDGSTPWTLIDQFDRGQLLGAGDKATAKIFAKRLGLTSWTYVRI